MIDNIYDHIIEAKIEAEKRMIEANTIIINKNLAFSDKGCIQFLNNITEYPPMIFGLKVVYANDNLPNNSNFVITKTPKNKMEQINDLEEEFGIDLITLFKAFEYGICVKFPNSDYMHCDVEFLKFYRGWKIFVQTKDKTGYILNLKWYKKRWALTRKELEDEKED